MFFLFGAVTLMWLVPWFATLRTLHGGAAPAHEQPVPVRKVTRHFALWAMGIGHITNTYGFYFLLAWLPLFLVQQRGYSIQEMSYLASLGYLTQGVSALMFGWVSDAWSRSGRSEAAIRRAMLVVCHAILAGCIVGILLTGSPGWLALWLVLAGIANGAGALNMYAIAQMFAGARASGTWVGLQNGIGNISGIVGPVVSGMIIDWSVRYAGAVWLAAAVAGFGALWGGLVLPSVRPVDLD